VACTMPCSVHELCWSDVLTVPLNSSCFAPALSLHVTCNKEGI
jgi:hypothetical protein